MAAHSIDACSLELPTPQKKAAASQAILKMLEPQFYDF